MPREELKLKITPSGDMDPDQNVTISSDVPLVPVDTAHIHLYSHPENDSLWYAERYELRKIDSQSYRLLAEWRPGMEYSLEADSATFASLYGEVSKSLSLG